MKRFLLIDGNQSWVRSLFSAMPNGLDVRSLRIMPGLGFSGPSWSRAVDGISDRALKIPGWTKLPALSTSLVRRAVKKAIAKFNIDVLVYTLPFYAGVAEHLTGQIAQVYYAHDPFRFYDWDVQRTEHLERKMLEASDGTFAISRSLAEDLRKTSDHPVVYSPNATSSAFVERLTDAGPPAEELTALSHPIIGCVGQINRSYDWTLIGSLADQLANATFVFIGPIFQEPPELRQPMEAILARPNVKWLGAKPHSRLPEFLRGFDVCLNPLAMTEHNDRRSPLRLYDYLATSRPVISTAVQEAFVHDGLVHTFKAADEGAAVIREAIAGRLPVDMPARCRYIRQNTWEARAMQFLQHLESLPHYRGSR
jgi:glycosyltransferase involved in cell wall biosynthesis